MKSEKKRDSPITLTKKHKVWRVRVLTATWFSYAGFYFCRKNFAIVKVNVQTSFSITNSELAHIWTAYLVAYMLGQFLTSYLGRKMAARILLLTGMAVTLICNVIFGFSYLMGPAGYWPMIIFMVINGFAQATGWPGNVGVLSNWLKREERGRVLAVWATSYQLGSILAKAFASIILGLLGALWSFWGAALIMFAIWILFFFIERDDPEDIGLDPIIEEVEIEVAIEEDSDIREKGYFKGWNSEVIFTVFFMGAVYFVFKFLRYSLDSWSPKAIHELFHIEGHYAGLISTLFDWIGFLGVLVAGWASDKIFKGRRYQVIVIMTVGMFFSFLFMAYFGTQSVWLLALSLSLCGFMMMGPDSLLAGVGAIDVGGKEGAIVAAGIINGVGSIGPIFQEEIIGWMLDHHGHQATYDMMIYICLVGIIGTLYLARRAKRGQSEL